MRTFLLALVIAGMVAPRAAPQTRRSRTAAANPTAATGAYNLPAATLHGTLKRIKGKELLMVGDGDQIVRIWITGKTKFLKEGREIKPSAIAPGSAIAVDTGDNPDLSPRAVNVTVEGPPAEAEAAPGSAAP